ncbi:MAG: OmpA family protein, partial [Chthoniobacterales bacterium]|nr:OmpA family protein [Chthoniobacterales bacterium]
LPQENVSNEKNSSLPQEPPKLEPTQILPNLQISADFLRDSFPQSQIPKENLANELEKLHDELLETSSPSSNRPILPLPEINNDSSPPTKLGMRFGSLAGYSELDDLLQKTGPLEKNTAPIFMPGDLLFDYDSAELRPEAIESLAKLGTLMLRNPNVRFRIEGHTDSFGPPDYNLNLSLRRAEAVKAWLIQHMGVPLDNIETRGYGSSRLIAPATGSIEEQQINRRVEIALEFLN